MEIKEMAKVAKKELKNSGIRCRVNTTAYQDRGRRVNVLVAVADMDKAKVVLASHGNAVWITPDPDEGIQE